MGILNNAKWVAFSQVFKILVQLVNIVYLARLISPSEYGIMAMALVVINFGMLVRDLGTAAAIIQKKQLTDELINAIFWMNLFMGIIIAGVICAFSPLFSHLFHSPGLTPVLLLVSIIFPLSSSSATHLALLERDSKFKSISFIEIRSSVISVILALLLAYNGFGVYSLVFQMITLTGLTTIQFWYISKWRPSLSMAFNFSHLKDILGFSVNLSLFNFINYFSRNADSIIIGRYMSASVLGAYSLAYRIMLFPLQSLTFVISRSLFPVLSKNQDDHGNLRKIYLNCVFFILFLVVPLMSGLAYISNPFVYFIFGDKWTLTASILLWLAPTAIIQAVLSSTGTVFMAKGRTDVLFKLGLLGAFLYVSSFVIGVNFGIVNFARFYFLANVINFFPAMYLLMKLIDGSLWILLKKCYLVFVIDMFMIVSMFVFNNFYPISYNNEYDFLNFLLTILVGGGVYLIMALVLIKDIRFFIANKIIAKN
ncbi:MOP flippase family protein [Klebsiella pneumoniae]|uniref:Flippase n=2 Tax=Klebsiella pneumoniae TaxID=573 RepID=A0A1C3T0V5_KLEPN|nr:MOP flippase family protein [Klebsiella pneumoniae]MCP6095465.1 MOP flippase family protein [Klebsiella pneumoniae]MCX9971752.1 MOP flippase family protein [Klebsiella pneumoniae]MCZ6934209.1 MOP flippase family protein [Klebsiella pneumoniae]MDE4634340.1 MOP flippase family protein [Klebsiella pneumoniae]MDM8684985.1 MOP flippase family protein [Klebsiella pneumoniae]